MKDVGETLSRKSELFANSERGGVRFIVSGDAISIDHIRRGLNNDYHKIYDLHLIQSP